MLKLITLPAEDQHGRSLIEVFHPGEPLVKEASGELWGETRKYLDSVSKREGKVYVLVNALGASEYYGANINGDIFPEAQLNPTDPNCGYGYKTFYNAGVYRHHASNKDPAKSYGKVVFATYNPLMHRVELVLEIDRARAAALGHQDLIDRVDSGDKVAVSMGARVPYDLCSKCGHKSKTRADHCSCIKNQLNQVLPDGTKVSMVNIRPKFFDLSFVVIGADRTSYAMAKVAYANNHLTTMNSVDLAEMYGLARHAVLPALKEKFARKQKVSEILKKVPAMSARVMPQVTRKEAPLPDSVIRALAGGSLPSALTSSAAAGILLRPQEYQRIVLICVGRAPLAERLHRQRTVFCPSMSPDPSVQWGTPSAHRPELSRLLAPQIPNRSFFLPALIRRLALQSRAHPEPELRIESSPLLDKVASGYAAYRQQLFEKIDDVVANVTKGDIKLLTAIGELELEDDFWEAHSNEKTASAWPATLLGVLPLAYLYGAYQKGKGGTSEPEGLSGFVREHPMLAASVLIGLTRVGSHLQKTGLMDDAVSTLLHRA